LDLAYLSIISGNGGLDIGLNDGRGSAMQCFSTRPSRLGKELGACSITLTHLLFAVKDFHSLEVFNFKL